MDNLTPEQKGRRAKEILEDPVFVEVLKKTRENIIPPSNSYKRKRHDRKSRAYSNGIYESSQKMQNGNPVYQANFCNETLCRFCGLI